MIKCKGEKFKNNRASFSVWTINTTLYSDLIEWKWIKQCSTDFSSDFFSSYPRFSYTCVPIHTHTHIYVYTYTCNIYIYICVYGGMWVYPLTVGAHMTCSTFILIYKASREHHHRIASSSLLYYTTFVFILLPRPGWIHYRYPMGPWGPASSPQETMGWREGICEHASSLQALVLFWLQNTIWGIIIILGISTASGHVGQTHWS